MSPQFEEVEQDLIIIKARSEKKAYLEACEKFYLGQYAYKVSVKEFGKTIDVPISFRLLNEDGENIADFGRDLDGEYDPYDIWDSIRQHYED